MRLFCITPEQFADDFEYFNPLLERFARSTGETSPEQVASAVSSGHMQMWGVQDDEGVKGILTTEIADTAYDRVCVIRIACGDARLALQERLLDEIGKWAMDEQRCDRVRFYGRKGWLKRFPRFREMGVIGEWKLREH